MITLGFLLLAGGLGGLTAYGLRAALKRPNPPHVQRIMAGELRNRAEERRFRRKAAHS